jgi:hypothetical protein
MIPFGKKKTTRINTIPKISSQRSIAACRKWAPGKRLLAKF